MGSDEVNDCSNSAAAITAARRPPEIAEFFLLQLLPSLPPCFPSPTFSEPHAKVKEIPSDRLPRQPI